VTGVVFDIKRFAVHDGPGLRTTVFLKGCPLACPWCHNPEGMDPAIRVWHFPARCIRCGRCVEACPSGALSVSGEGGPFIRIDRDRCIADGACVAVCPSGAMAFDGREMTVDAVLAEVAKDRVFYEVSGGGVTFSGGEPLAQPAFCRDILAECRREGFATAVDTCLWAEAAAVESVRGLADLFLVDLKLADPAAHERWTGRPLEPIRRNFEALAAAGARMIVRIPLVPGATADEANVRAVARYVRTASPEAPVELVRYNPLAGSKWRRLGRAFDFADRGAWPDAEAVERLRRAVQDEGVRALPVS
jgi:pyruvate formate lyase activating enzyme